MSIFDEIITRKNTHSLKWDYGMERFGSDDILPMWVADMDFKSAVPITEAIIKRAEHGVLGYTKPSDTLSEAVAAWMKKRHGWEVDTRWIAHSPGVVTSVDAAVLAFTQPGEKILIQTPVYYPFFSCVGENGRQLVTNPLRDNNGYYGMDLEDLEKKLASGVKMMILCSPHNPIGRVWSKAELEQVAKLCLKYGVILVSDEIHFDLVFKGHRHIPIASLSEEILKKTVTLISPTKTFNIAGLSQSFAIISDPALREEFNKTLHRTGAEMLNIFGMTAAEVAYTQCEGWLDDLIPYLESNLETLLEYFEKHIPAIKAIKPEATYMVWLDCRALPIPPEKQKEFFTFKAKVGLNDGITFGPEGSGFHRINFACPRKLMLEGLERIRKAVNNEE